MEDVVAFKQRFYPCAWARYDLAIPGSLKLLPAAPSQLKGLAHDYENMQAMLFGTPPEFGEVLDELKALEAEINAPAQKHKLGQA